MLCQLCATLGQETINTPIYTQMDLTHCHIMTETMARYTMIGETNMAGKAIKILKLAAFAPAVPSSMDYNLRVYFIEDTPDAMEVGSCRWDCTACKIYLPLWILMDFTKECNYTPLSLLGFGTKIDTVKMCCTCELE